jgi:DNA-binding transcriptional regulator YiaG
MLSNHPPVATVDKTTAIGRIRSKCRQVGQAEWARQLGVSRSFVSQVIRGERSPSPAMLRDVGLKERRVFEEIA